jgi:hypothetical protein
MSGNAGLDLTEDGDGFILTVVDATGAATKTKLTAEQLLILSQSAPAFRERILSKHKLSVPGMDVVLATPVVQIGLNEDSLGQDILLTLIAPTGGRLTYALPVHIAEHLAERLPVRVADLKNKNQTKQ